MTDFEWLWVSILFLIIAALLFGMTLGYMFGLRAGLDIFDEYVDQLGEFEESSERGED